MEQTGYKNLLSQIQEADVVGLCRDLVRFKSVNPPGDELEIAEYVADVLHEAGLTVEMVPHTPTRASVLARLEGSGEMPALLYTGHLDVVPVGAEEWLHDPLCVRWRSSLLIWASGCPTFAPRLRLSTSLRKPT